MFLYCSTLCSESLVEIDRVDFPPYRLPKNLIRELKNILRLKKKKKKS